MKTSEHEFKKKTSRLVCIFKGYNGVFWNMIKICWYEKLTPQRVGMKKIMFIEKKNIIK